MREVLMYTVDNPISPFPEYIFYATTVLISLPENHVARITIVKLDW